MIASLLDTDLYKLSMQQAVLEHYPDVKVTYQFKNRGEHRFTTDFIVAIEAAIEDMGRLSLTAEEKHYLSTLGFFKTPYLEYLANYKFNPDEVFVSLSPEDDLQILIGGPWHSTILWEVPLMALISELYFKHLSIDEVDTYNKAQDKSKALAFLGEEPPLPVSCMFAEFGTRRRRSRNAQNIVLRGLMDGSKGLVPRHFIGTSNVRLAMAHGIRPIGTMAHEWIMGVSALESLRYANRSALHKWKDTYRADLGIALTDTFGTDAFFKDFDLELAKVYDGVRHDSGDPIAFGEKVISGYQKLGINPKHKTIIFSDGLNVHKCQVIQHNFAGRIKIAFGIGTHLTNDFDDAKALNMVIKLRTVSGIPVVKISDEPGKETGEEKAIEVAKWTFGL